MKVLSRRQYQMMFALVHGVSLSQWAASQRLVKYSAWNYMQKTLRKLDARTNAQAAVRFACGSYDYFLDTRNDRAPRSPRLSVPVSRNLSKEAIRIYDYVAMGLHRGEIGARLGVDERRVTNVLSRSYHKLGAWTLIQAVVHYKLITMEKSIITMNEAKAGWIPPEARERANVGDRLGVAEIEYLVRLAEGAGYGLMLEGLAFPTGANLIAAGYLVAESPDAGGRAKLIITDAGHRMIDIVKQRKAAAANGQCTCIADEVSR